MELILFKPVTSDKNMTLVGNGPFSKKDLELHKKIREYQKMALSRNTSGVKMFQGNDNVV